MAAELTAAPLSQRTTLRLGGPARRLVVADSDHAVVETLRAADAAGEPVLILGGGSNLVIGDDGFDGVVVEIATRGVEMADASRGVQLSAAAGEDWDPVVEQAVAGGLNGIEALSGIPGRVGATPIQNVGAYGQEVAQTITAVRVFDRVADSIRVMVPQECGFTYRHSVFKGNDRYVVLGVTYSLDRGGGSPVRYAELARVLGVAVGGHAPVAEVRAGVLELRRAKGMVLSAADHDTWSAGSFFTNPILAADEVERLPPELPRWPLGDGRSKISAAWLIEHSGFAKGYGDGPARVSTKHTLALTNRGGARTDDLLGLAREIRSGVLDRFDVELVPEPVFVGCAL